MTFDLQKIYESKEAFRCNPAARPIAEKLRMLDAMRERELAIRWKKQSNSSHLREKPAAYQTKLR
jgi:hypothetical protein